MKDDEREAWKKIVLAQNRDELTKIIRQNLDPKSEQEAIDRLLFQKRPDIFPPVTTKPGKSIPKPIDPSSPKQFRKIPAEQIPFLTQPLSPSGGHSYKDLFRQVLMPSFSKDLESPDRRKSSFENTEEARGLRAQEAKINDAVRRANYGVKYYDTKIDQIKKASSNLESRIKLPPAQVEESLFKWLAKNPKSLVGGGLALAGLAGAGYIANRRRENA